MKEKQLPPALRFSEFKGDWEPRKIGSFVTERDERKESDAPLYSLTIEHGITPKSQRYERAFLVKDESEAYKLMQPNDFASNPMNLRFGALARNRTGTPVKVSRYYDIFFVDDSVSIEFVDEYLRSYKRIKFFDRMSTGSLEEKKRVHYREFLKFQFLFPSVEEQEKIASFLGSVDEKISLLEKKRALLVQYKKGVMQQIFSQQIRFKDDNGSDFPDWEEKRLDQIAKVSSGGTPLRTNPEYWGGQVPWVTTKEVDNNTIRDTEEKITELGLAKSSTKKMS